MARPTKKAGRPSKQPEEVKSATLSVRLRPDLRSKLESQAGYHGKSISEEVERRMIESFADDEMREHLDQFYRLIRTYLQTIGKRRSVLAKYELSKHVEALNLGFELLILGAFKGTLPEDRVRQFWTRDLAKISKGRKDDSDAINIAIDAFTTLTLAGLASVDPLKLSQWHRDEAEKNA